MRPVFGQPYQAGKTAKLVQVGSSFAFESSFDRGLVDAMKTDIPSYARKWDNGGKRWLVDPSFTGVLVRLCHKHLGVDLIVPKLSTSIATEERLLRLEYLGRCKDRAGVLAATGYVDGEWSVIIPETVLRQWFETPASPTDFRTLYQVLAVKPAATFDEIRTSFRRLALIWHPDRCREADAAEQFKAIQAAWEQLKEPLKRKKYDAGLYLQAEAEKDAKLNTPRSYVQDYAREYRSPYRSGWILAAGVEAVGRFVVSAILEWQDITDDRGRVMVASWPAGAETFEVRWV